MALSGLWGLDRSGSNPEVRMPTWAFVLVATLFFVAFLLKSYLKSHFVLKDSFNLNSTEEELIKHRLGLMTMKKRFCSHIVHGN